MCVCLYDENLEFLNPGCAPPSVVPPPPATRPRPPLDGHLRVPAFRAASPPEALRGAAPRDSFLCSVTSPAARRAHRFLTVVLCGAVPPSIVCVCGRGAMDPNARAAMVRYMNRDRVQPTSRSAVTAAAQIVQQPETASLETAQKPILSSAMPVTKLIFDAAQSSADRLGHQASTLSVSPQKPVTRLRGVSSSFSLMQDGGLGKRSPLPPLGNKIPRESRDISSLTDGKASAQGPASTGLVAAAAANAAAYRYMYTQL